jgi:OmpW family
LYPRYSGLGTIGRKLWVLLQQFWKGPYITLTGQGSVASLGELGKVRYGPAILTAEYHLPGLLAFRPYVGAGTTYANILKDHDAAVSQLGVTKQEEEWQELQAVLHSGILEPAPNAPMLLKELSDGLSSNDANRSLVFGSKFGSTCCSRVLQIL